MYLLIDDCRNLKGMDEVARNADEGAYYLSSRVKWACIYLDHDLGLESISGYQLLVKAFESGWLDYNPDFQLVTSNPVGRYNMAEVLYKRGYRTNNSYDFYWSK